MKRVTGVRQIEIADLMVSANNFTSGYAEALVLGTPKDHPRWKSMNHRWNGGHVLCCRVVASSEASEMEPPSQR